MTLYRRASVFAFLSEYEGFGLTPLEAMAHGAAPVVLDTPVAREIYGPAARYVALGPDARDTLGRTISDLLGVPTERAAAGWRGAGGAVALRLDADSRRHTGRSRGGRRCPITSPPSRSSS